MNVFLLIDSRHEPMKSDLEQVTWLASNGIPFSLIFTKIDKLSNSQLGKNIAAWTTELSKDWEELPKMITTSSETGKGKEELLDYIAEINKQISK